MTERIAEAVRALAVRPNLTVEVRYDGGSRDRMRRWLGTGWSFRRQGGGDIGQRMARALAGAFEAGAHRAVLIGADIPGITAEVLADAFEGLACRDVVIGPAADGGYYLIGMTRKGHVATGAALFAAVSWGTDSVFETTIRRLAAAKTAFRRLPVLRDVDRPEDLYAGQMELG
jgi:rSAM/selenodomain-associated transferase 1